MTTVFGRNLDVPVDSSRFYTLADEHGDLAVYDSHTGRYAPFFGDTAVEVATDLNNGTDDSANYQWEDSL